MDAFWAVVAGNSLAVIVLAVGVTLLGRFWKNPPGLHLLWVLVLVKLITPPVVSVPIPWPTNRSSDPAPPDALRDEVRIPNRASEVGDVDTRPAVSTVAASPVVLAGDRTLTAATPPKIEWRRLFAWVWGLGAAVLAFRRGRQIVQFRRLLRSAESPPPTVVESAEQIGKRLGMKRIPVIRMLSARISPLVWFAGGGLRLVLPIDLFRRLDADAREAVLAHELAHVRRKDHWVRWLELAVSTLFWWHPAVWWACRKLRELEELCCDRLALDAVPHGGRTCATALLDVLDYVSERSVAVPLSATGALSALSLSRRIEMLKDPCRVTRLTAGRLLLLLAAAAAPMAVTFAGAPQHDERTSISERRRVARVLVDRALLVAHWQGLENSQEFQPLIRELASEIQSVQYDSRFIVPGAEDASRQPQDAAERSLLDRLQVGNLRQDPGFEEQISPGRYRYYQAVVARQSCLRCHTEPGPLGVASKDGTKPATDDRAMSVGDLMAIAVITFPEMGGEAAPDGQAGNEQRQQQSLAELTERQKRLAEARQEAMKLAVAYRSGKRSLAELLDAQRREAQAAFDCIDALVLWMDASELGPSGSQAREHWATVNKLAILERIRDDAFRLWEAVETKHREGSAGSFDEAQAREQHYLLKHAADDMRKRLEESADR